MQMKKLLSGLSLLLTISFVFSQNPGNIGLSNLTAWYKPNGLPSGPISTWTTTYPTGGSAITLNDVALPYPILTYTPFAYTSNYNPTIDFAGNSITAPLVFQNTNTLNLLDNNLSGGQGTMLCVYYLPTSTTNGHIVMYREASSGSVDGIQFRNLGAIGRIAIGTNNSTNASRDYTEFYRPELISYHGNKSTTTSMSAFQKGKIFTGGVSSSTTGDRGLLIGGRLNGGAYEGAYTGFISEVIFYNRDLTLAEYEKVNSYLAIKYGITLDNTLGGTSGDYRSTTSTLLWDADLSPLYHRNVIGIGRDDAEALYQKQSHQFNDTTRLYISNLAVANDSNVGTILLDDSYVMLGDNRGIMCESNAANLEQPDCGYYTRLTREWKLTKTNFSQLFNVDLTLANCLTSAGVISTNIQLLVDDDGDFSSGSTQVYRNGDGTGISISYSTPTITISNLSNTHFPDNQTKYFTIRIQPVSDTINAFSCSSYTSPSGLHTWTTAGMYTDTLMSSTSCDSLLYINLSLGAAVYDTTSISICIDTSISFNGRTLNTSGLYADTFISTGLCDSFFYLHLSVFSIDSSIINASICSNAFYSFNGLSLNTTGIYRDTLVSSHFCDSFVILNLSVIPTSSSVINATICSNQGYFFNGVTINTGGTYLDTLINSRLCDSFITLNLTVNLVRFDTIRITICANQFVLFNGIAQNTSGTYNDTFSTYQLCDSFVTLLLNVRPIDSSAFNISICSNQNYVFNGIARSTAGSYKDTLVAISGCDSIVTLHLSVLATSSYSYFDTICNGNTYAFNGLTITTSGTYRDTLINSVSCDSFIILQLTVLPPYGSNLPIFRCFGDSFLFNGVWLHTSGTYRDTLINGFGCDSIVVLTLQISPYLRSIINRTICANQTYLFNGNTYNTSGSYYDTIVSASGCDSFLTLNLVVHPINSVTLFDTICKGEILQIGSYTFDSTGVYTFTVPNIYTCDSQLTLYLYVLPLPLVTINNGLDTGVVKNTMVQLNASGANTYIWNNGTVSSSLQVTVSQDIQLYVVGYDSNGCHDADTIIIYVIELADTSILTIPNAFSPNADGINDIFRVLNSFNFNFESMDIFNRWGELVFHSEQQEDGWNGQFRGRLQAMGTYVYYVKGNSKQRGDTRIFKGTVTLLY